MSVTIDKEIQKAEVLEIEADAQEIGLNSVLEEEILNFLIGSSGALSGIVLQPLTVAHFGVPLLAGG